MPEEEKQPARQEEKPGKTIEGSQTVAKQDPRFGVLNEPFAIWLLSSILLGGLTALYTALPSHSEAERAKAAMVEKLDFEIDARFSQFLESMEPLVAQPQTEGFAFRQGTPQQDIDDRFLELMNPPRRNLHGWVTGVYPEFENARLSALIMQLRGQINIDQDKDQLKDAAKLLSQLHPVTTNNKEFLPIWRTMKNGILLDRWNEFFYTDCPVSAPFC